jgi:UPF0176 protein
LFYLAPVYILLPTMKKSYVALAYYHFVPIVDPQLEVEKHKDFFESRDCAGRIYLSHEGINGQMSASLEEAENYIRWLRQDSRFEVIHFKFHSASEHIFPRMTVKYRRQLVALDLPADAAECGEHVSPKRWREMLEQGGHLILDVRNQYEWRIGHFEGAILPPLDSFREFPEYAEKFAKEMDPKNTKVMMYCTGGIRCELYSSFLKKKGFEKVYQLQGGVINYGLTEGSVHWRGKLFVFDDRLAVSIDGKPAQPIAHCFHCYLNEDTYYNCANMDCNELFICCDSCLEVYKGCCSFTCQNGSRVRPIDIRSGNKPFRRKHEILNSSQDARCEIEFQESSQLVQA